MIGGGAYKTKILYVCACALVFALIEHGAQCVLNVCVRDLYIRQLIILPELNVTH